MTGYANQDAINLRAELAKLRAQVDQRLVRFDFSNLVTNGTFSSDSDWAKGTGWTIGSGILSATSAAQNTVTTQDIKTTIGGHYLVTFDNTVTLGTLRFYVTEGSTTKTNTDNLTTPSSGTYSLTWTAGSKVATIKPYAWGGGTNSGTFDNVYVWEADPSDDAPWLRLPHGYHVGKYGQVVCDGVVLHPDDYTEIFDGHTTFIKPATAPGVSTVYSVWGTKR